jgi:hypothetical protein
MGAAATETATRLKRLRGPVALVALCVVPVLLWVRAVPPEGRFAGTTRA